MKKLLLIDGNSILFRAYHATLYTQMMRTSSGIATNAVYGFVNMFLKAMDTLQPDAVMVAFDAGKKNFRHDQFEAYKGTRKEVDEDLIMQFPIVREFLDDLGVKRIEVEGYEADDVIGSLAKSHPEWQTIILTSDKDMLQLIDASTKVTLIKKGISDLLVMDEHALMETYQLKAPQIIDLKALMGDPADNIPGVKGVGEKTAIKLLTQYETLDGIYQHIEEIKGKLQEKLISDEANAKMSYELATIYCDLQLELHGDDFILHPNYEKLREFYVKYEMNSFVKKVDTLLQQLERQSEVEPVEATTLLRVKKMAPSLYAFPHILQVVTTPKNQICGIALKQGDTCYFQERSDLEVDDAFLHYLQEPKQSIMFDCKSQAHLLQTFTKAGIGGYDLFVAAFLLDSNLSSYEKVLARYELHSKEHGAFDKKGMMIENQEIFEKYVVEQLSFLEVIYEDVKKGLVEEDLLSLYEKVDYPLISTLYAMENDGIAVKEEKLQEIEDTLYKEIRRIETQIYTYAGHEFNINSPKQLAVVLFDELGLKANKKRSTAVDVLEKLMDVHPIIPLLMEHRKVSKVYSTYAVGLRKHIEQDGRIHTIFNQCLAQTGRLSSVEPNLQNISVRDEVGKQIRKAFVADEGYVLLSADYSQIELRILASLANETNMIQAFNANIDIHLQTAMAIYHKEVDEITETERRNAKAVNFGIVYGISDFGLAENIGITVIEARTFIEKYFELYPNIRQYMEQVVTFAKEHGYVETMLKRRRYIPEIASKNYALREFGKRAAMNSPIQGSAADLIKLAMLKVDGLMKEHHVKSRMILQVHDELIFEVLEEEKELMAKLVQDGMEHAYDLTVSMVAQMSFGKNWYEAK